MNPIISKLLKKYIKEIHKVKNPSEELIQKQIEIEEILALYGDCIRRLCCLSEADSYLKDSEEIIDEAAEYEYRIVNALKMVLKEIKGK